MPETKPKTIDLTEVTCGLVPAMAQYLAQTGRDAVTFLVRRGVEHELWGGFGTGGDWAFELVPGEGHDEARFTRRAPAGPDPLNLLDY